uniref:hypothetical protein n=1 Tax=Paenibacillus zanthoxyli TaxID=369399 RepID=UPI0004721A4C
PVPEAVLKEALCDLGDLGDLGDPALFMPFPFRSFRGFAGPERALLRREEAAVEDLPAGFA